MIKLKIVLTSPVQISKWPVRGTFFPFLRWDGLGFAGHGGSRPAPPSTDCSPHGKLLQASSHLLGWSRGVGSSPGDGAPGFQGLLVPGRATWAGPRVSVPAHRHRPSVLRHPHPVLTKCQLEWDPDGTLGSGAAAVVSLKMKVPVALPSGCRVLW